MPIFSKKSQVESYCQSATICVTHYTVCEHNGEQRLVKGNHGMFSHYYVCSDFKVYKVHCKLGFQYTLMCYKMLAETPTKNDAEFLKEQHLKINENFSSKIKNIKSSF
jgi:hypothetical protein